MYEVDPKSTWLSAMGVTSMTGWRWRKNGIIKTVIRVWLSWAALLLMAACSSHHGGSEANPSFAVSIAEDYNRLFTREEGWTGADIATSLPLQDRRILWLFGDSWIGKVRNGRHTDSAMVHNTVAIQQGLDPAAARLEFFYHEKDGKPDAFIQPFDEPGELWLSHGGIQTDLNNPGDVVKHLT
jgi:hypothetical protein